MTTNQVTVMRGKREGGSCHEHAISYGKVSQNIPVKGLVGTWLTPDRYQEGGALGYKVVGRAHIHDSITINTISLPSCSCALPVQID
jgi:hypothetical protein